jgi:hypothetical protein
VRIRPGFARSHRLADEHGAHEVLSKGGSPGARDYGVLVAVDLDLCSGDDGRVDAYPFAAFEMLDTP